jgi:hypothetical protein
MKSDEAVTLLAYNWESLFWILFMTEGVPVPFSCSSERLPAMPAPTVGHRKQPFDPQWPRLFVLRRWTACSSAFSDVGSPVFACYLHNGREQIVEDFKCYKHVLGSSSSSSSSSYIVGPIVDPFRSHVSISLFKGLPRFLLPARQQCFITLGNLGYILQ